MWTQILLILQYLAEVTLLQGCPAQLTLTIHLSIFFLIWASLYVLANATPGGEPHGCGENFLTHVHIYRGLAYRCIFGISSPSSVPWTCTHGAPVEAGHGEPAHPSHLLLTSTPTSTATLGALSKHESQHVSAWSSITQALPGHVDAPSPGDSPTSLMPQPQPIGASDKHIPAA